MPELMNEAVAAKRAGVSRQRMAKLRRAGRGPKVAFAEETLHRIRAFYHQHDVDAWVEERKGGGDGSGVDSRTKKGD